MEKQKDKQNLTEEQQNLIAEGILQEDGETIYDEYEFTPDYEL